MLVHRQLSKPKTSKVVCCDQFVCTETCNQQPNREKHIENCWKGNEKKPRGQFAIMWHQLCKINCPIYVPGLSMITDLCHCYSPCHHNALEYSTDSKSKAHGCKYSVLSTQISLCELQIACDGSSLCHQACSICISISFLCLPVRITCLYLPTQWTFIFSLMNIPIDIDTFPHHKSINLSRQLCIRIKLQSEFGVQLHSPTKIPIKQKLSPLSIYHQFPHQSIEVMRGMKSRHDFNDAHPSVEVVSVVEAVLAEKQVWISLYMRPFL